MEQQARERQGHVHPEIPPRREHKRQGIRREWQEQRASESRRQGAPSPDRESHESKGEADPQEPPAFEFDQLCSNAFDDRAQAVRVRL